MSDVRSMDPQPAPGAGDGRDVMAEAVDHPRHYNAHPSGVECITVCEHYDFLIGNVIKYCWRAGHKGDALEDYRKARFYLNRKIENMERDAAKGGD